METKALKKQMGAAIAMVLVAAIALAASTYAWFVTNNKVDATTSTISAQSNAAFMKIKWDSDGNQTATTSDKTADFANINDASALYPAQWSNDFNSNKQLSLVDAIYNFETAYGTDPTAQGVMKSGDWTLVGTPAEAVTKGYAVKNTFKISSKGTDLTKLKVDGSKILTTGTTTGNTTDQGNSKLDSALRILVCCNDNWVLCNKDGVLLDSENRTSTTDSENYGLFGSGDNTVTVNHDRDTTVDMYVYYDGNDNEVYSNNLANLKDAASRITISFSATPDNK